MESHLPFEIDRSSDASLISQVVDGLRRAIVSGAYPIGTTLPTFREIADGLGVSMNVVRTAIGRLSEEGLLGARRGVGSVVKPNGTKLRLGRVIVVQCGGNESYYSNVLLGSVRESLSRQGYFVSGVTAFRQTGGRYDFSRLEIELREHVDLVVLDSDNVAAIDLLSRMGVPFVVILINRTKPISVPCCRGCVREAFDVGMAGVVAQCARVGVRDVLVVRAWRRRSATFAALQAVGISARDWRILPKSRYGRIEGVQRAGMNAFVERLAKGMDWLPELLIFPDDDFLAAGCLTALSFAGVRIPEDVRVVAISNKGLGPVYPKTLARLEIDPASFGGAVARYVHAILSGKHDAKPPVLESTYVLGESFP